MLQKLKDVPRFLMLIQYYSENEIADENMIKSEYMKSGVLEGTKQNYQDVLQFCILTGLLKRDNGKLILTTPGKKILDNHDLNYSLTLRQKEFLAMECMLKGVFWSKIILMFKEFHFASNDNIFWYHTNEISNIGDMELLPLLYQSDILIKKENVVEVNTKYTPIVFRALKIIDNDKTSEEKLAEILETQKEIGKIAEEIAIKYEKKRLLDLGLTGESLNVEQISKLDASAGFDIRSYNDNADEFMTHDRFIEVKGSTGKELSFFWSKNEIEKAKQLGTKYWVYFVGGVDLESRTTECEIQLFQDPSSSILKSESFNKECVKTWITKNL